MCVRIITFFLIFCASAKAEVNYEKLLQDTYKFYDSIRSPNGDYLDYYNGHRPDKVNKRVSSASTGAGLVSLTIAHSLGIDEKAEEKALTALMFLNGKAKVKPQRNVNGLFLHFYNFDSGTIRNKEFSTIDTALLMSGAIFCKNVFKNPKISAEVNELWKSIKWQSFKVDELHYHLTQDENGKSLGKTRMFNEYILLADYCSMAAKEKPLEINEKWIRCRKYGVPVLSDLQNRMLPLFTFQFPLYLSPIRTRDQTFHIEALKAAQADKLWWENELKVSGIWGSSAGACRHGYSVDATGKNHYRIINAPSVAAYAPFNDTYKKDFEKILQDYPDIFQTNGDWNIPWRHSLKDPDWPAKSIQSIDLSPLLYGLAALHPKLGFKFFQDNSHYKPRD